MKTAHDLVVAARSHIREVSVEDAESLIRAATLVIDVREADEYAADHLPGAINFPPGLLEFNLSGTTAFDQRDLSAVLYCKTSVRAALAAASMQSMGYVNVVSVEGGYDAWTAAGKPVAMPRPPSFE